MSSRCSSQDEEEIIYRRNGTVLSSIYLPPEVVILMLCFVPWEDLPACRAVCKLWRSFIDRDVSEKKLITKFRMSYFSNRYNALFLKHKTLPFFIKYAISREEFGSNILSSIIGWPGIKDLKVVPTMWRVTLNCFGLNTEEILADVRQPDLEIFIWYSSYQSTESIRISVIDEDGECVFYSFQQTPSDDDDCERMKKVFNVNDPGRFDVLGRYRPRLRSGFHIEIAHLSLTVLTPYNLLTKKCESDLEESGRHSV